MTAVSQERVVGPAPQQDVQGSMSTMAEWEEM